MTTNPNIKSLAKAALACLCLMPLTSCHTSRKSSLPSKDTSHIETIHVGHGNKLQKKIVEEAMTWVGTPYTYAAMTKGEGTDCSGMVMRVYEDIAGRKLPRNSAKQAEFCKEIKPKDVNMGDLVFFATGKDPDRVSHVGIVVDDDNFIHASSSKGVVVSNLSSNYFQRTFKMFGRVPDLKDEVAEEKAAPTGKERKSIKAKKDKRDKDLAKK